MKRSSKKPAAKAVKPQKQFKMAVEHLVTIKATNLREARTMLRNKLTSPVKPCMNIMVSRKTKVTDKPVIVAVAKKMEPSTL